MRRFVLLSTVLITAAQYACAAEVYSANTVGYTRLSLSPGFNLVGEQFASVGDEASFDINSVLVSTNLPGLTDGSDFQATIRVWNGLGYTTYGWLDADDGTANDVSEWNSKWITEDMSAIAEEKIDAGQGFWINNTSPNAATATFSGQVLTGSATNIPVESGFTLICNPFPKEISVQDVQSDDLLGIDDDGFRSMMLVWTGIGYTAYGWLDADDGTANEVPEWNSKWITEDMSALAEETIGVGEGFWIDTCAPASISFTK